MPDRGDKTLYIEAYALDGHVEHPHYAVLPVTPALVARIGHLMALVNAEELESCRIYFEARWDDEDKLCVVDPQMVVSADKLWLEATLAADGTRVYSLAADLELLDELMHGDQDDENNFYLSEDYNGFMEMVITEEQRHRPAQAKGKAVNAARQ